LIAAVDAVVQEMRPINDDVLVKGPTPVDVAVSAQLELVHGDPDGIMAEVENRLRAMFQDPSPVADVAPLQVGEDLTLDRMIHEIMAVSGVKRVIWVNPTADVATPADGLAVLTSVSLTTTWASEI
jgi:phage-related baseplate assembly protein